MNCTTRGVTWLAVGVLALATGAAGAQVSSASDDEVAAA